jgi:PAS domain S-box-containing protein
MITTVRVLVVEDDENDYLLTRELLAEIGNPEYAIDWQSDYSAACAALTRGLYDVCLLDYRLGSRTGLELLQEVGEAGCDVPIIVISGHGDREIDLQVMQAGAAYYLPKSGLDPDTLERTIRYGLERHRAQRRAHFNEQRLKLAVEAANIGLWDWDVEAGQSYFSPQWKAQLGHADHEVGDLPREWSDRLHPADRDRTLAHLREAVRDPSFVYEDEFRLRHRDGSYRWIHTRGAVLRDKAGRARRVFGAHVDITHRRETENAVRQLNAELEQHVSLRTAELAAVNRELEAFSYSVSHDLRSPLRAIDGFAQALAEEYYGALPAEAQHYIDRVRAGAKRMGELIDDLLILARVARSDMRRQAVDLSTLADEIAANLRSQAPERRVSLAIEPGHVVTGDPGLLRLALENLLANAWKYTGKRREAHIAFGAEGGNGDRVFFVRDDGAGFDPLYADKLFGPFQRLHGPGEFEGTGVGLAIVHRIIQRHGGRVWAEGAVDHGATFYFTV